MSVAVIGSAAMSTSGSNLTISFTPQEPGTLLLLAVGAGNRATIDGYYMQDWNLITTVTSGPGPGGLNLYSKIATGSESSVHFDVGGSNYGTTGVVLAVDKPEPSPVDGYVSATSTTSPFTIATPNVAPSDASNVAIVFRVGVNSSSSTIGAGSATYSNGFTHLEGIGATSGQSSSSSLLVGARENASVPIGTTITSSYTSISNAAALLLVVNTVAPGPAVSTWDGTTETTGCTVSTWDGATETPGATLEIA